MDGRSVFNKLCRVAILLIAGLALTGFLFVPDVNAQEDTKKYGWFFTAELASVWTSGNSETSTFGLGATTRRIWKSSGLKLELGGARTESSIKTRTAIGSSPDDYVLREVKRTEKTAELYFARGRYDYKISKYFLVFGGTDWLRNEFAGIESRFLVAAGAGNTWFDRDDMRLKTDYGVTYTFEEEVVENPFIKTDFPGARFGFDFWRKLTGTTEFLSTLVADWNLDNTDDFRIDFKNELPISVSTHLKFKPAIQLLWENEPALTEIELLTSGGVSTGEKVLVPLEDLDTLFTVSLVFEM
ncbi:MAG: DUF481 domain-containing protein [Candidatus Latescibacterota bacterium]|nr:MAG: DUF481 domain-containing protein [Candidatus Latescibacterota bacterium]